MSIVVQKYGGSSVADAEAIKRVARRIVETQKAGHRVCVVVSAMGDTTDELLDLAEQVTPTPPARELDMLLTSGERISMALVAMDIAQLGSEARSFTGSQPGVITDDAHAEDAISAANEASREHPSRVLVLARGNKRGAARLDAQEALRRGAQHRSARPAHGFRRNDEGLSRLFWNAQATEQTGAINHAGRRPGRSGLAGRN